MRIPIEGSEHLVKALVERARLKARENPEVLPTLGRNPHSVGGAMGKQHWQLRGSTAFPSEVRFATVSPSVPSGGVMEFKLWHVLCFLPCLLAIAVLSACLLASHGDGPAQPSRAPAAPSGVPASVAPPKADGLADTPTCPGCGKPMVARRNRETCELIYACKASGCQRGAPTDERPTRPERD